MTPNCCNCGFFSTKRGAVYGECRRYPPTVRHDIPTTRSAPAGVWYSWPPVGGDISDLCGEWKPQLSEAPP